MSRFTRRSLAGFAATTLGVSGAIVATGPASVALAAEECVASSDSIVRIFSFNDLHGRIAESAAMFTLVEQARAELGEDAVLLTSNGDSIGGSTFVSAVADDNPTLDILNAADVAVSATGNHEYDKGWSDLSGRVADRVDFTYLAANITEGSAVPAPLKAYELFEVTPTDSEESLTIAVIGAVTKDLPALVSPAGIAGLTVGDPVDAVNAVAAQLKDGDDANGEADIVVASIHEGAGDGTPSAADAAAISGNFDDIYRGLDADIDVVFNGHTHYNYTWTTSDGRPLVQASAYAGNIVSVDVQVGDGGELCVTGGTTHELPDADASFPRVAEIQSIVEAAEEVAAELGAEVIGNATEAISTPGDGGSGTRDQESPMSNMVAQMFFDMMSHGNDEFIGIQNPGGTRTSFDAGEVTYEEAALVLPFANSLFTTQLTGAQFKTALEQQWQRSADGTVPSRAFLALGLSDNVSYTYDENRDEGDRITGIYVNGAPIDPAKLYTVGSGSFLISGGDNFRVIGEGVNAADAGLVDLTAWVDWIGDQGDLSPDYSKRGISVTEAVDELTIGGDTATFTLGEAIGGNNPGTLDMYLNEGERVSPQLPNETVTAYIGDVEVGGGEVTDGVATVDVDLTRASLPTGEQLIRFNVQPSGTDVLVPVTVKASPISVHSAGTRLVGSATNLWGTASGAAGETIVAEALVDDEWVQVGSATAGATGGYVLPLSGNEVAARGEYTLRVRAGDVRSGEIAFERINRSSVNAAPLAPLGRTANAWGTVDGQAEIRTQVLVPGKGWSTSQVGSTNATGGYVIPLTYGANTAGEYRWRLVIDHAHGEREITPEFTQTRVAAPTATSAGTARVSTTANVWGTVDVTATTTVWTEAFVPGKGWSTSRMGATNATGGYVLPLTYGNNVAGTYQFRVAATYPGLGTLYSAPFTFVRTN